MSVLLNNMENGIENYGADFWKFIQFSTMWSFVRFLKILHIHASQNTLAKTNNLILCPHISWSAFLFTDTYIHYSRFSCTCRPLPHSHVSPSHSLLHSLIHRLSTLSSHTNHWGPLHKAFFTCLCLRISIYILIYTLLASLSQHAEIIQGPLLGEFPR